MRRCAHLPWPLTRQARQSAPSPCFKTCSSRYPPPTRQSVHRPPSRSPCWPTSWRIAAGRFPGWSAALTCMSRLAPRRRHMRPTSSMRAPSMPNRMSRPAPSAISSARWRWARKARTPPNGGRMHKISWPTPCMPRTGSPRRRRSGVKHLPATGPFMVMSMPMSPPCSTGWPPICSRTARTRKRSPSCLTRWQWASPSASRATSTWWQPPDGSPARSPIPTRRNACLLSQT